MELHTYQYHYLVLLSISHTLCKNLMKKDILFRENHILYICPYLTLPIICCTNQFSCLFIVRKTHEVFVINTIFNSITINMTKKVSSPRSIWSSGYHSVKWLWSPLWFQINNFFLLVIPSFIFLFKTSKSRCLSSSVANLYPSDDTTCSLNNNPNTSFIET